VRAPALPGREPCAGAASPGLSFRRLFLKGGAMGGLRVAEQGQLLCSEEEEEEREEACFRASGSVHRSSCTTA